MCARSVALMTGGLYWQSNSQVSELSALAETNSELVQRKWNIETSVGVDSPTEAGYGVPLPLVEAGVSQVDQINTL